METPGLISRDIITQDGDYAVIKEVWDNRIEGCPVLVFKKDAEGLIDWPNGGQHKGIITVIKEVPVHALDVLALS